MSLNHQIVGLPKECVHPCYRLKTWRKVYAYKVNPIRDRLYWPKFNVPSIFLPHGHQPQVGRPHKSRRKSKTERVVVKIGKSRKLTREHNTVTCDKCGSKRHTSRLAQVQEIHSPKLGRGKQELLVKMMNTSNCCILKRSSSIVAVDKGKGLAVDDGSNKKKCPPRKKIINIGPRISQSQTEKRKTRTTGEDDMSGTQATAASQRGTRSSSIVVVDKGKGAAVDDGFLVSESFLNSCPNINAITLERYLSDHRPILLRDAHVDYGPTPFRFFHYWLEIEGFAKMVEDGWRDSPCDRSIELRNLTGKLKHLKNDIRVWNKTKGKSNRDAKAQLKLELEVVASCIDNFNGTVEDIKWRGEIVNKLQDIDKLHALETTQKAKVKKEFRDHFSKRFCKPGLRNVNIQMTFSNQISVDQKRDLEGEVTNDEIKKAVWDCGTDKAPGPEGFTFGFYRKF
nr:RNA-directed DNA polymerase, eukaryota, reverse transcriptase zinc-binding domain protein [Tanacetum cinerariifolium]